VSEGCRNCYAEATAARFSGPGQPYAGLATWVTRPDGTREPRWTGATRIMWSQLDAPIRWRRPRHIFVNSMSDLFHEKLHLDDIAGILGHAIAAHHLRGHTFQILTKRPQRMLDVLQDEEFWEAANCQATELVLENTDPLDRRSDDARATLGSYSAENAPPGIWLGVSVEDQATAEERIPLLLRTPAALRFISAEPLLGRIDLVAVRFMGIHSLTFLDWVIAGGESGVAARPMHPGWARRLRDDCIAAHVPFFFKQWGEWAPAPRAIRQQTHRFDDGTVMFRTGKNRAGNLLDGRTHQEFPQ
jgi:protein gp37